MTFDVMFRNYWTTMVGAILAGLYYLDQLGPNFPKTRQEWMHAGVGLGIAVLGFVAKSATTGSIPSGVKSVALATLTVFALVGCTTSAQQSLASLGSAQSAAEVLATLKTWKGADLDAALARATAANHQAGMMCYPILKKYTVGDLNLGDSLKLAGAFDAFEAALLLGMNGAPSLAQNPIVQDVHLGCAALVGDARLTLIKLGVIAAGSAVGAGGPASLLLK